MEQRRSHQRVARSRLLGKEGGLDRVFRLGYTLVAVPTISTLLKDSDNPLDCFVFHSFIPLGERQTENYQS
jgi:hypothetical protein